MREILVICPQERDLKAIRAAGLEDRYRLRFAGSDLDQLEAFDPDGFLEECETIPADGVVGTKDQSALLAALLAERRGLPGPSPESLVRLQHKPTARFVQQLAAPEATPRFALLDGRVPFDVPFFVKPVVGRLSQNVFRIDDPRELVDLHEIDRYTARYAEIAALAGADPAHAHGFLAEELLSGDEVTLEGYVHGGEVTTIGVTDSLKYEGTLSFESFVYPSALSAGAPRRALGRRRARPAAARLRGRLLQRRVLRPRAGAGADHRGERADRLAVRPARPGGARPLDLRRALPARARRGPGLDLRPPETVWRSATAFGSSTTPTSRPCRTPSPTSRCSCARACSSPSRASNDAQSYRLAIFYGVGETREEAIARCRERAPALRFRLAPLPVR